MAGRIHLVRHAEGLHNLRNDPNIPDAPLSERGFDFAEDLGRRFIQANSNSTGSIMCSPLRRTIHTSLGAFPRILNSVHYPENSGKGVRDGVKLEMNADLQEISDMPCNTGSTLAELEDEFPQLKQQIQSLDENWYIKTGPESPLPSPLAQRKVRILEKLDQTLRTLQDGRTEKDVVVVTHQGVIALLAPAANIPVAQWQSFSLVRNSTGELSLR